MTREDGRDPGRSRRPAAPGPGRTSRADIALVGVLGLPCPLAPRSSRMASGPLPPCFSCSPTSGGLSARPTRLPGALDRFAALGAKASSAARLTRQGALVHARGDGGRDRSGAGAAAGERSSDTCRDPRPAFWPPRIAGGWASGGGECWGRALTDALPLLPVPPRGLTVAGLSVNPGARVGGCRPGAFASTIAKGSTSAREPEGALWVPARAPSSCERAALRPALPACAGTAPIVREYPVRLFGPWAPGSRWGRSGSWARATLETSFSSAGPGRGRASAVAGRYDSLLPGARGARPRRLECGSRVAGSNLYVGERAFERGHEVDGLR
jgi:hypothetical protein